MLRSARIMSLLAPYDSEWPAQFEAEASRIRDALEHAAHRIEHVGSTSIPGLHAKPIIDIQVSVASVTPLEPFAERLGALGYSHLSLPSPGDGVYPFFHRPATWPTTHHLHLCQAGGLEERKHLGFRDWLRAHPEDLARYAALKQHLSEETNESDPLSVMRYTAGKGDWIKQVVERALEAKL